MSDVLPIAGAVTAPHRVPTAPPIEAPPQPAGWFSGRGIARIILRGVGLTAGAAAVAGAAVVAPAAGVACGVLALGAAAYHLTRKTAPGELDEHVPAPGEVYEDVPAPVELDKDVVAVDMGLLFPDLNEEDLATLSRALSPKGSNYSKARSKNFPVYGIGKPVARTGSTLETLGTGAPDVVGVAARAHQAVTRAFEGVIANRIPVELRQGVSVVENAFDVGTRFTIGLPAQALSLIAAAGADIAWKDVLASFRMAQAGQRSPITAIFHALGFVLSRGATIGLTPVILILEGIRHLISKVLASVTTVLALAVLGVGLCGKIILPPAFRGIVTGLRLAITPFAWILYLLRQGFVWLAGNYAIESNTQSTFERAAAGTSKKELNAARIAKTAAERHLAVVKAKEPAGLAIALEVTQAAEALKEAEAKLVEAERFAEIDREVVALGISELQMAFAGLTPFLIFKRGFSWALPLTTSRIAMGQALLKDLSLEELAGHIDSMLISRDRKLQLFAAAKHYKDVRDFRYEGKPMVESSLDNLKQVWGRWDTIFAEAKVAIGHIFDLALTPAGDAPAPPADAPAIA